jgi:cellulose synthase/poly-beta-1,6-N-acetylglucosamine synthase-like glycosyltransferase
MIPVLAFYLVGFIILQDFFLWILLKSNFKPYQGTMEGDWPVISILIPCRNEENNLPSCLEALENLDYPKEKLQVILGNDQSTDQTYTVLQQWAVRRPWARVIDIVSSDLAKMNGKANALSQMAKEVKGEALLFTDADCRVPVRWAKKMVEGWRFSGADLVTGITNVKGHTFFGKMQAMDWWLTLGMVKVVDDLDFSLTAMGNNMLISKRAYFEVGGFEGIPFSLTEDFEIGREIQKKGFRGIHLVSEDNLVNTNEQENFTALLKQRQRWMSGAMTLPGIWKLVLGLQVIFFPAILFFCFLYPVEGFSIWLLKVVMQSVFIHSFALKSRERLKKPDLILYEIYYLIISWSTIVYYFWASKTVWKGREY